ncbi:oligopeptide/dipeptide ABC transporter ATP-binding protein [Alkalihalobacillus deserti]|uniref:oligopeptide/dipeptide ABC transporter ATP-binding protein n=1 Tax=Alkalihalobacillus deserti TaxID=2879466 RepID=UPI001D15B31E|nr:oligopeptide/dipeptide ABC transporter ATP-binding protein [Alkalihalobacillus deserti]
MKNLLEVVNLQTAFKTDESEVVSVDDVSFALKPGETIGIVGESGCGKSVQAQILDMMKKLREETGTAIMLITHDLGVIAEMADKVIVMYAGQVVEEADVYTLFESSKHPYTQGLMTSIPHIDYEANERLVSIAGNVPSLKRMPKGYRFQTRCSYVTDRCLKEQPPMFLSGKDHWSRCWLNEADQKVTTG